jgi:hypothetical protein
MVLKLRHFGQQIRNTLKILKGRVGYLDRSCEEEVLHRVKEERNSLHAIIIVKATWIGHLCA